MEEVLGMCLDQNQYVFPIKVCSKEVLLETLRSTSVADDVTLIDLKGEGSYIQLLTVYDATHVATDDNVMVVDWKNDESYLQLSTENVTKHTHTVLEHGVQDAKHVKYDTDMLVDWKNNESYLQLSTENVTNHTHIGLEHGMQDAKDVNYHTGILVPELNSESGKIRKDNFNSNSYAQNDHSASHDELEIITGTVNQVKKAVSKKKCCGFQCKSIPQSLFKFPNVKVMNPSDNIKQYGEWIKNIGNRKLLDKSWSTVYNNYYVCEKHFEDDCFDNVNRTRLKKGAIPTKFDCASLSDSDIAILLGLDFGSCLNQVEQNNLYALKFEVCMNNLDFFLL
ncbi:THAP domain-containing protein 7 [Frankliniella fusca]|uniref:THAP domain-containing protein 7 n=1 Tax=Frankliniella fusca TaxID=407009 RepID=A0AAE1LL68_9NEOP|nr:THAP domain-containing protein 7 [Frankliniella fusca]